MRGVRSGIVPQTTTRDVDIVFKVKSANREPTPATKPSPVSLFQIVETFGLDFYQALDNHIFACHMASTSQSATVDRWLTTLETNRAMASSPYPILPFSIHPLQVGEPIRFLVGPEQMPFDVHISTLAVNSPAFNTDSIESFKSPFALPSVKPEEFGLLTKWLYKKVPPTFMHAADLQRLCELWVAASQLGIWEKANALLRQGMELMTPSSYVCPAATTRWVFSHTPASSPLRGFVIAVYAQRSQPDFATTFQPGDMEIWKARTAFMRKLEHARKLLVFGEQGLDGIAELRLGKINEVNGGVGKGKLPVPGFLVWNFSGDLVPDTYYLAPETKDYEDALVEWLKRK
jgi:hypothetical protein